MSYAVHKTKSDRIIDVFIYVFLTLCCLSAVFPLYFVFIESITPYKELIRNGGFVLFPEQVTLQAYRAIFGSKLVPDALKISVVITVIGTFLSLLVTICLAYPLSKKDVPGGRFFLLAIVFTMLFSGGIVPTYLVVKGLGLINSIWSLIIPTLVSPFYMFIMRTYFINFPTEIEESAKVDGCGDVRTLFQLVIPLSMPIIVTIGLFYGVIQWNSYFNAILYLSDRALYPIQVILRNMIVTSSVSQELNTNPSVIQTLPPDTIRMATVVVTTLPLLAIYPFIQKYFIKGMLVGSIKG
ncbi:carbohydrate ABC transporter permease [Paenibacillus sp. Soil750]|uniref:carbohydrate ABC transporter permease n=1 Tax=Paenibacillus sp. Soil750 TaxID=1736398 RepID=UPI00070009B8|nr:carbohydrate ABC transporter permease [Paenibacillus sp. Soil750]KRE59823.1 ABC transporter permease [Paenibacillus sp. Soil750]